MTVLVVGDLKPSLVQTLRTRYGAVGEPSPDVAGDVDVVVTSGRFGVDAGLMARLPALRAVLNFGVGYDTTDVAEANRRGVVVTNTPDVLTDCVADTAAALVLDVLRGFSAADRWVRAGNWSAAANYPLTRRVRGTRVGILGLGRIGRAIAHRLEGFGVSTAYHNRRELPGAGYRYLPDARSLAAASDVLVVAASGGADSAGLVSAEVLTALGPQGYLVNVARGSVVDEDALVEALREGRIAGAGLDVFAHEPHVPAALLERDDVVLLPHLGSGTVQTRDAMERLVLDNLDAFLADGRVLTPVPETAP
ncbi:2-hydroxyacid dehydrogenase [Kineococcus sp. SYSU DK002]|uniref:2-hydroxyacid dehydrogenase n=1 Tax=Kineococcus sp. SYSU DK002 TaxID=3383123 RepID=UPI003D7DA41F